MYAIILNHKYEEVGIFENYAKREYRTLAQIDRTIEGTLKIKRVGKRDEWCLLWSADQREIGRVRKVEAPAPVPAPQPVTFRDLARMFAAAAVTLFGVFR